MNKKGLVENIGGRNILLLGLVSFLNDFSSEMILPILPIFIAMLGGSGIAIGFIGGVMQGLPEIFKVFAGYISDRFRYRKRFIFSGYFISQLGKFFMTFASSPLNVFFSTSLDKLGKGIRDAPRDALISESLPKEKGRAFGIQRTFDSAGAILGSLTILFIVLFFTFSLTELVLLKRIILVAAILGFISLIPIFFLKEGKALNGNGRINKSFFVSLSKLPKALWVFIAVSVIFAFANFSYMFFMLKASMLNHTSRYIIPIIPLMLYVLYNMAYTAFAIPFGKLSDRIGRIKILIFGAFIFAVVCGSIILASSLIAFIFIFLLYGLVYAIMIGNQRAFVSDLSPNNMRATALGAFQTITGISSIIAGVLAGWLFDINSSLLFFYGLILSIGYIAVIISFRHSLKKVN